MDVFAVAGGDGAGKTATALNLAVALRDAGSYAAVLDADLGGNVASLLEVEFDATLGDVLEGETRVRDAVAEAHLSEADVPESDLAAYHDALAADRTQFRAGADQEPADATADEPDVETVPVVAGFETRSAHTGADPEALSDALESLVMAYDVLVVDTGNGPAAQSPTVDLADGLLTVTTPDPAKLKAAAEDVRACTSGGVRLLGVVVNRASEKTSIAEVADSVGAEAVGVVPEDARTRSLEPVSFTVPTSPAAEAYGRLAESTLEWDGASARVDAASADGGAPEERSAAAGSERDAADGSAGDDEDDSGGFLSGLFDG